MMMCSLCELLFVICSFTNHLFLYKSEELTYVTGLVHNVRTLLSLGSLTWTPARKPVPRLEGQVRTYPRRSFHMNSQPLSLINLSTCEGKNKKESEKKGLYTCLISRRLLIAQTLLTLCLRWWGTPLMPRELHKYTPEYSLVCLWCELLRSPGTKVPTGYCKDLFIIFSLSVARELCHCITKLPVMMVWYSPCSHNSSRHYGFCDAFSNLRVFGARLQSTSNRASSTTEQKKIVIK